jgi:S1-C subfamily serine protease
MYSLPVDHGMVILNLVGSAPADSSGLRVGDILVEINGKKVKESSELERELGKLKPDDTVQFTIQRGARRLKTAVKLEEFPPQLNRVREGVI